MDEIGLSWLTHMIECGLKRFIISWQAMRYESSGSEFEPLGVLELVEWIIKEENAKMHSLIYGAS